MHMCTLNSRLIEEQMNSSVQRLTSCRAGLALSGAFACAECKDYDESNWGLLIIAWGEVFPLCSSSAGFSREREEAVNGREVGGSSFHHTSGLSSSSAVHAHRERSLHLDFFRKTPELLFWISCILVSISRKLRHNSQLLLSLFSVTHEWMKTENQSCS